MKHTKKNFYKASFYPLFYKIINKVGRENSLLPYLSNYIHPPFQVLDLNDPKLVQAIWKPEVSHLVYILIASAPKEDSGIVVNVETLSCQ